MSTPRSAGVVGAGVIGLTTAVLAQESGFRVTVYADRPTMDSTSARAPASFKPAGIERTATAQRMLEASWEAFQRIARANPEAGVRMHVHWDASSEPAPAPWYLSVMEDAAACERPEVPGGYEFGWRYRTFFIDTSIFLKWLAVRFETAGGLLALTQRFVALGELGQLPHEVVFNCTGLGARALCGDDTVAPVKGQIVVVAPRPDMDWSITHDGFYVYPRRDDAILGGTWEADVWDEGVEHGAVEAILRANQRILPELKPSDVRATYAGLRPYRAGGIRVDVQSVGTRTIVHNYGHAGAGITLCWGSARAALGLVT